MPSDFIILVAKSTVMFVECWFARGVLGKLDTTVFVTLWMVFGVEKRTSSLGAYKVAPPALFHGSLEPRMLLSELRSSSATFTQGDFNYDGGVDSRDFGALANRLRAVGVSLPLGT